MTLLFFLPLLLLINMEVILVEGVLIYQLYGFEKATLSYKLLFVSNELSLIEKKVRELNYLVYSGFMIKHIRKDFYKIVNNV